MWLTARHRAVNNKRVPVISLANDVRRENKPTSALPASAIASASEDSRFALGADETSALPAIGCVLLSKLGNVLSGFFALGSFRIRRLGFLDRSFLTHHHTNFMCLAVIDQRDFIARLLEAVKKDVTDTTTE